MSLGIAAPGVHSVDGLQVTLELPPDALRRLILGPHSAGAELLARPSEELEVASAGATGSQLILSPQLVGGDDGACAGQQPGSDCHHKDKEGTLRVVVTQGTEARCRPQQLPQRFFAAVAAGVNRQASLLLIPLRCSP